MQILSLRQFQCVVLGIVALTVLTRLPSLLHPQPINDEWPYSVVANEIVDGGRPYVDAADRKPPLLFWTYAAVYEVAGEYNWKALHVVALMWTLGTMAGLYAIGRRLFNRETGLIAALLYSVFQPWMTYQNLAFNGELMMNLPIVWAWAIGLRRSSSHVRPELLAAGALLCAGFLLKQPAAIAAVPLGIYLLLPSYRASRNLTRTASIAQSTVLAAGFFGTLGLATVILYKQGILREAFYWTITDHAHAHVFVASGVLLTLAFIGCCLPLVIGAAMAYRDKNGVWGKNRPERMALFGLTAASALGAAAGGRFYSHYYIQLIPPLALIAAPHYAQLWSGSTQPGSWLMRPRVTYVWLGLTVVGFSTSHLVKLVSKRAPSETGRYLADHSTPKDRIFVWGNDAKFYLEARRRPACRYFMNFPLTGYVFPGELHEKVDFHNQILPGAWLMLERDFNRHPPKFIIDLRFDPKNQQYPIQDFPVLAHLMAERYHPVLSTSEAVIYQAR